MRAFTAVDGRNWVARIEEAARGPVAWQVVRFDEQDGARQRVTFRPTGWLESASLRDLIEALEEGAAVRARWVAG